MFLVHGVYEYRKRAVAYRNDYCLRCAGPRTALQIRSFKVLHIMFIPLVPLGFWRDWRCSVCGQDPHESGKTSKGFKWVGVAVLLIFGASVWAVPLDDMRGEDVLILWGLRFGLPVAAVAAAVNAARSRPDVRLKDMLALVTPADQVRCQLCAGPLMSGDRWRCTNCGAERVVVKL